MSVGRIGISLLEDVTVVDTLEWRILTLARLKYIGIVARCRRHVPLAAHDVVDVLAVLRSVVAPACTQTELVLKRKMEVESKSASGRIDIDAAMMTLTKDMKLVHSRTKKG